MLFLSPLFLGFLLWGAWYREDVGGADSLMVFDEYHFLSAVHKRQLFAWIRSSGRLESVRFVLIANRIDDFDDELMGKLRKSCSSDVEVVTLRARLGIPTICEWCKNDPGILVNEDVVFFLQCFHTVTRGLFSDEVITYRNVQRLADMYRELGPSADAEEDIANVLCMKMPVIGMTMATEVVRHLFEALRRIQSSPHKSLGELRRALKPDSSAVDLLIHAALLDEEHNLCTYPDFVNRGSQGKKLYICHPILRLAKWVSLMRGTFCQRPPRDEEEKLEMRKDFDYFILSQLEVVDQAGFPFVTGVRDSSQVCSVNSVQRFFKSGDYSDLVWLKDVIEHGYAVSWEIVKEHWGNVSDLGGVLSVLSVCPNPSVCVTAIPLDRMFFFLQKSSNKRFPEALLEYLEYDSQSLGFPRDSFEELIFTALWTYIRTIRMGEDDSPRKTHQRIVTWLEIHSLKLGQALQWINTVGREQKVVYSSGTEVQRLLKYLVIMESRALQDSILQLPEQSEKRLEKEQELCKLWEGYFSSLLDIGFI